VVAHVIRNEQLNNHRPDGGTRPHKTNCVALAFSKVLGISHYATVNLFVDKGWVPRAQALEHDGAILRILAGLPLAEVARDEAWLSVRARLGTLPAGRYFACNSKTKKFKDTNSIGHAFAIIRSAGAGWGVAANNQEKRDTSYASVLQDADNISVWGPA
jgi:hypothetical protein